MAKQFFVSTHGKTCYRGGKVFNCIMGIIKKDFKFKKIENFLTQEEVNFLSLYCEIRHRTNFKSFDLEQGKTGDTKFYGDIVMETILLQKKDLMEKETGLELLPTYAFWRMYTKYAELKKHTDRPACEISVTVHIDSDKTPWPIYIDGNAVETKPGDAVISLGCELPHWRDAFQGDWHAQTFLHYVDKNGKYKDHYMDKRQYWGLQ